VSSHPRRVIFVNRVYWPSGEATAQLLTDLAEGLAARGWDVHVVAAGEAATERLGVTIHRTGGSDRHGGLVSRLLNFRRFQRAEQHRLAAMARPGDIVVAMTDPPLLAASLAPVAARLGLRLVCWVQDIYPEIARVHFGPLAEPMATWLRPKRDAAWRNATACVTLGDTMRGTLLARGVAPEKAVVIPNWAPRELHTPPEPAAVASLRRARDPYDRFSVVYSGNLGRVHEFATVLGAASLLRDSSRILFTFVGRGPRFDEVVRFAHAHGLANVRLLPPEPRERLAIALAAADVHLVTLKPAFSPFVYPSKLAGVLASGRPALFIGPPEGDIGRLLQTRQAGAVFAPGDAAGVAALLGRWQASPGDTAACGRAARAAYEENFTFQASLDRWEKLLSDSVRYG